MSVTMSNNFTETSTTVASSWTTTGTFMPVDADVHYAAVMNYRVAGGPTSNPTMSGAGLTWDQIITQAFGNQRRLSLFRAYGTGSAAALTIDCAGVNHDIYHLIIDDAAGMDTSGTHGSGSVVQSVSTTGGSEPATVTLAAFGDAINNATYFIAFWETNQTNSAYSDTQLADQTAGGVRTSSEWKAGQNTTPSITNNGAGAAWIGIGIEVKTSGDVVLAWLKA